MSANPVSPVFVGRTTELDALDEALRTADSGTPAVVLVAGEAGVGKTRLLEEFLTRATASGAVTAVGGCIELGAEALPFAPVAAALRMLDTALDGSLARAAAGRESDLARLAPGLLRQTGPGTATAPAPVPDRAHGPAAALVPRVPGSTPGMPPADPDGGAADRVRLYDLTLHLLDTLGADRTLVIAVEDLHWADSATRELLAYWVRMMRRARVLLVATYRADAVDRRHPLRPVLAELDRVRAVRRLDLARLTRDQVAAQLRGILGDAPAHETVEQIFARSEGNAFFVEELADSVRDGRLTRLSDSLRDLLLIRIEQLPEPAQQVVRLTAVGGPTVPHRLLAEVAAAHVRLDADALDTALRAAVGAYVLAPARDGDGYTFRHALVREAALDDLLPGERMRSHAAFARALEEHPGLVPADEAIGGIAVHWWAAENPARALPALLIAARHAGERYAFGEQLRLLDGAQHMWERLPDPEAHTGAALVDILEDAATAARYHNAPDRGLALLRQAIGLVDADEDPRRAARLWLARGMLLRNTARASGLPELRKAEALLAQLPPTVDHASVSIQIARAQMLDDQAPEAVRAAREALEVVRALGDAAAEADVSKTLAWFLLSVGDVEEAEKMGREAAAIAERVGRPDTLVHVLANHASLLEGLGRHEESVATARRALALAQETGQRHMMVFTSGNLAESLLSLGEWDAATQVAADAFALSPGPRASAHLERVLAELAGYRGDHEAAVRHRTRGHTTATETYLEPQGVIPHRALEIAAARDAGDLAAARALAAAQMAEGIVSGHQRYGWPLLVQAARAEMVLAPTAGLGPAGAEDSAAADPRAAAAAASAAATAALRACAATLARDCDLDRAYAATVTALLDTAEGRDDAVERWIEADAAWSRTGKPYDQARAKVDLAAVLAAAGRRTEARDALSAAHATASRLGAHPLRAEAELLARRLGLTLAQGGTGAAADSREDIGGGPGAAGGDRDAPAAAGLLTPREREVLLRLAQGYSNRRIAEELFISVKTASVHVSNILGKLEVANRGEAAALAHRLGLLDDVG
ncbi:helix-turn-helix transcriptional regulator [Streptodolium elevatio]|uniref:AAA family ATPase n=1 Tax=Streptodolium elevatio TaxID=3157996 RepID=A0ABV3DJA4_9ACTN